MSLAVNIYEDKKKRDLRDNMLYAKIMAKYVIGADLVWQSPDFEFNDLKVNQIIRIEDNSPLPYKIKMIMSKELFRQLIWPANHNKLSKCTRIYFLELFRKN